MSEGDLGSLIVSIGTNLKDLDKGLNQAQKTITGFQQSANKILGLIGFSLTASAFVQLGKSTIEYGETLHKLALQTGMTASEIAKLKYVAEQSETSVEAVAGSFRFLSRAMAQAGAGNAEAITTFAKFHVEFKNADGTLRNYNDVMMEVADRIKNTSNDTVVLAEGQKLLGRNVLQVLPLLREGADGIKKLTDHYSEMQRKIGLTDTEINKFAKDSDSLSDAWKDVWTAFQFMLIEVMTPLIPKMKEFTDLLVRANWAALAEDIMAVADAIGKVWTFLTNATQLGPLGRLVAGASQFAGTLAGGGNIGDAFQAAGGGIMNPQGALQQQLGSQQNPVDLGTITAGGGAPGAGGDKQGIDSTLSMFDRIKEKMTELKAEWGDVSKSISEVWKGTMDQIATGFGTSVADMIVDGKDFGEAMKEMWKDIAKTVIAEIVKIIAQQIILFTWQTITGTVGSGNLVPGGGKKFLGIFREGGMMPQAREGLLSAPGMRFTGNMGEAGFPVVVHPNEVISPIDKLFEFIGSMRGDSITVNAHGRAADDPQLLAQLVQLEGDRQRRRP